MQRIKILIQGIKMRHQKKTYIFEDICPYPFEKPNLSIPFPNNYEMPKFKKYKGKVDPREHIKEFYIACQ